ncbi:MAG TPA: hypothetical protein VF796_12385, partial [Humisphaera sp.]
AAKLVEPYLRLRDFAVKHLIVDDPKESFTRGFVLWRCVPGATPDASGTTEMLRVARALWRGADAFGRAEDRAVAVTIVEGYARHQTVQQGIWMINNYYAFASRSFATNSFVIDYDTDFLREVADWHQGKQAEADRAKRFKELADNSRELMRQTPSPCGLLYDLVQPELKTMYWGLDVCFFSPNDVIQTNNACTTAMTVAKDAPEVARGVLSFLLRRVQQAGGIHRYFYGRTGEPVNKMKLGPAEMMSAAMLAAKLNEPAAVGAFIDLGMVYWQSIAARTVDTLPELDAWAWLVSELLIGIDVLLAT